MAKHARPWTLRREFESLRGYKPRSFRTERFDFLRGYPFLSLKKESLKKKALQLTIFLSFSFRKYLSLNCFYLNFNASHASLHMLGFLRILPMKRDGLSMSPCSSRNSSTPAFFSFEKSLSSFSSLKPFK